MKGWIEYLLDLPPAASSVAQGIDRLHFAVITTSILGAAYVFLLGLWYLLRHRRTVALEVTARRETSPRVELFIIVAIQVLFLVFWVVGAIEYGRVMTPPRGAMRVYVMAKQWMWKFAYPDGRSSLDVLTVPVDRDVMLIMTSRDVIHSFYVPAFRIKHDVVPGRYYTAWFRAVAPGNYDIECAEFCGINHSRMLGQIRVLSAADYASWLSHPVAPPRDEETGAPGNLVVEGRAVAVRRGCLSCHTVDGQTAVGPTWAALYGSRVELSDGRVVTADEEYLTRSMMDPLTDIVRGFRPVMPTYQGTLRQPEAAALIEYIESLATAPYAPSVTLPRVVPENEGQPQEPKP